MTTLATDSLFSTKLNTEVQAAGGNRVMVSELAVKLGRDVRAQLATLVLFRVVTGSEASIRKGWTHIVRVWLNLFVNSLTPAPFLPLETPASSVQRLPPSFPLDPIPLHTPSQVVNKEARSAETGFFSAFTSYISSYAADDPPEPSDEELESTLCTVDCIAACHLEEIFINIL
jgi:brefeldin A-resistance guanine nucleotide exchange factor 1